MNQIIQNKSQKSKIREPPYQHDDYHYIGDHHKIVRKFGEINGYPIYVMYKNILLDKYVPEGWDKNKSQKCVVYRIFDDHAYFYDVSTALNGVQHFCIKNKLPFAPDKRLLYRQEDDDDVKNYIDMVEYGDDKLSDAIESKTQMYFMLKGRI